MVVYYGFPKFQEWRSHRKYFDARTKVLEYQKLLYEVESIKKQNDLGEITDKGLNELLSVADELRPTTEALPGMKRFLYGWLGSAAAFTIFGIIYFLSIAEEDPYLFVAGAFILSFVAGVPTVFYRSDKAYKSSLFGGGAGLVIAFIIGSFS